MAITNAEWLAAQPVGAAPTFESATRLVGEVIWPYDKSADRPTKWLDRLAGVFYRLCTPTIELPILLNYGDVSARLCRGAQPSRSGFKLLKDLGVDTVINLRVEAPDESAHVRSLGMNYFYFPMDPIGAPTHEQAIAFLRAACDPRHGKVYFHCYHGADRTGVLGACYRVAHDGWSLTDAAAEMDRFKFHRVFQTAKLEYLLTFAEFWRSLDAGQQAHVLHQS